VDGRQFAVGAVVFALICWLTLAALVVGFAPEEPLTYLFYALLALAVSGTLMPIVYYLHVRFGDARENPRWFRYIRQSLWVGALAAFYLWLNSLRTLSVPAILLGVCIAALVELIILRPAKMEG